MPREEGFPVADMATDKLYDPKFKRLWRAAGNEMVMNAAVVLHDSILLGSWAAGDRVTADDAAPYWMTEVAEVATLLQAVGLLDEEGRIPEKAWRSWFGPAHERRRQRQEAGRIGGQRSVKRRLSDGQAPLNPTNQPTIHPANAAFANVKPFVTMTDQEQAEARQRERAELKAKMMARLGVQS